MNGTSHQLFFSVIKSKEMRCTEHVARTVEKMNACGIWWGNLKGRYHLDELGEDDGVILKKYSTKAGLDSAGLMQRQLPGHCEHGVVNSCFMKCGENLD
jgi:hypothetical protein